MMKCVRWRSPSCSASDKQTLKHHPETHIVHVYCCSFTIILSFLLLLISGSLISPAETFFSFSFSSVSLISSCKHSNPSLFRHADLPRRFAANGRTFFPGRLKTHLFKKHSTFFPTESCLVS